ncbi:DUF445 domain-containing protein [Nocardioides sp. REDSEA-S30_B4]|jgi:uncharacterized membrane-anchored protein YjiN (DUF445 family)|uniref:DUF445 domain-containing protein n=1 Tax=Nocardioides sp. REDSEA-S30_B4 TaxID=1811552 RepID=UPI000A5E28BC|nr:DUF445 domain-containing protein [Nocardioides sp. REDSEA-S30_B4]
MTTTAPFPTGDAAADHAADVRRAHALRRMRAVALGLLLLAALVFVLTHDRDGFWGFVNAGAEASMVGAIADWFAVTALFRHPLGLPIPHTALIPRRKDELGRGLEEFVGENFLSEEVVRERVLGARVSSRVGGWLVEPDSSRRVAEEAAEVIGVALSKVRDEHVRSLVEDALVPRFRDEPISPLLGNLLAESMRDDLHHGLVDLALEELHGWLVDNPDTVTEVIGERAPWWAPPSINDRVTSRIHLELVRWVADIRDQPRHRARLALDSMLRQLAEDLQHDEGTMARTEALKERLLDRPQVIATAISLWEALRHALTDSLDDPEGAVRLRMRTELERFARRLVDEPALRERLDGLAADAVVFAVERYGSELTQVITHTIERWDGKEAAERIELHVGRDLQFIRINGTIVGGLVGVLIHTVVVLL